MSFRRIPRIGKNGRRPQKLSKLPFKEEWPMILDNQVSTRGGKNIEAACLKETFAFLTCLKDNNHDSDLCRAEAERLTHCHHQYRANEAEKKRKAKSAGDFIPEISAKDMDPTQLNKFLSHFPHKLKKD